MLPGAAPLLLGGGERAVARGTAADLFTLPYSHQPEVYRGFYEEECRELLRSFFQSLRKE